jgi:hypothetical protein
MKEIKAQLVNSIRPVIAVTPLSSACAIEKDYHRHAGDEGKSLECTEL